MKSIGLRRALLADVVGHSAHGGGSWEHLGRWLFFAGLCLMTSPSSVWAQDAEALAPPLQTAFASASAPWILDDGRGEDIEWEEDPRQLRPGQFYLAMVLRGGGIFANGERAEEGPSTELSALFDVRLREGGRWHMRIGVALLARSFREGSPEEDPTSPITLTARFYPLVMDLHPLVSLRLGPDFGLVWVAGEMGWVFRVSSELAVRFPHTPIELGIYAGTMLPDNLGRPGSRMQAALGALVGGLF